MRYADVEGGLNKIGIRRTRTTGPRQRGLGEFERAGVRTACEMYRYVRTVPAAPMCSFSACAWAGLPDKSGFPNGRYIPTNSPSECASI